MFAGPRGGRLNRSGVSRDDHRAALEDAGLRTSLRLHDLRHTAAASWLASGLPLIYAQRQLGHASLTTTEALDGHLEEAFLRDAAERVEQRIWNAPREARRTAWAVTGTEPADATAADLLPRALPRGR